MNLWHRVNPEMIKPDNFLACIEIPQGSKNKYELDKYSGALKLDRILYTSTHDPHNYGFIPKTLADDGDALDVLVISSEPIVPLALVECRPIGMLEMLDGGERDAKILAVAVNDPVYNGIYDVKEVSDHVLREIKHFFTVYKSLENKDTAVDEVYGRDEAIKVIKECLASYKRNIQPKVVAERKARGY